MYRVKKRVSRKLNKSSRNKKINRTKSLNRRTRKRLNSSRTKSKSRSRSKSISRSRNMRVRRRLKRYKPRSRNSRLSRSKNKRRNRKSHRGGFVEIGAAIPCIQPNAPSGQIMDSIANQMGKKVSEVDFKESKANKEMLERIKKFGAEKWSPEQTLENDYGRANCLDKPRGVDKNFCAYKRNGICNGEFAKFDEGDLSAELQDKKLTDAEIKEMVNKRISKMGLVTNSSGDFVTAKKGGRAKKDADKFSEFRSQKKKVTDWQRDTSENRGPSPTINADLKSWAEKFFK